MPRPASRVDHCADAIDPRCAAAPRETPRSAGDRDVDEVAEHVHVDAVADRGDLDAGDELDAGGRARCGGRLARGDRIVIGDAQHRDAGRRRARDELGRRAATVRRRGVGVKVDQRGRLRRVAARAPVRRGAAAAPGASASAWYSRISRSRCARSSSANSRKICLPSESSKRSP